MHVLDTTYTEARNQESSKLHNEDKALALYYTFVMNSRERIIWYCNGLQPTGILAQAIVLLQ